MKILIVEDQPMARQIASINAKRAGIEVDTAENGHKAYQLATSNYYDMIFMDIGLPDGQDGAQTAKKIRDWEENNQVSQHIPILALTAHAGPDDERYCLEHGIDKVFLKPLSPEKLQVMLAAAKKIVDDAQ